MKKLLLVLLMFLTLFGYSQETLSLSQAIERGLKNNFSVLSIKKDEKVAQINNTWGNAGAFPSLDFSVSYRESSDDNNIEDFDQSSLNAGVEINWVLFNGFSIKIAKHKLNEFDNLSKGNTALVVENTIQSIVLAYYSALLEKEKMGVSLQLMKLSEDRYEKMKMQKELGNSVTFDVLQAQNAYLEDKSSYLLQKANYNNTIRELNFLMGEKSENKYTLITDFAAEVVFYDLKILLNKMLSENNTLKNKYISIKINELDIALAKSAYLPKLSIGSGVSYRDSESDYYVRGKQLSKGNNAYASLNLTYKIYNGGSKKRAVQIARIEKEIAEIDKEEIKRQLENQMARLLEIYDVRKQLFLLAEENMKAAELNLKISEEKFKTGSINSFNYRDVQVIYQNAAIGRLNAIFNLVDTNTSLIKLTGGLIKETSKYKIKMKDLLRKLPEIALLVVLLTVVSFRSDKIFCEDIKPDDNGSRFSLKDARLFFPEAEIVEDKNIDFAVVNDNKGNKLGELLCTSPLSDGIIGYAGTVPVLIAVDNNKIIRGIKLMPNVESPGFIRRIRQKGFFNSWDGMQVDSALTKEVDAVSGASMTTNAVKQGIKLRLEKYSEIVVAKKAIDYMKIVYYLGSIFVLVIALLSFFNPGKLKKFRNLLLLSSVLILGLWQGNFISLALLYGWFLNGVPLAGKIILILIVLLAVLIPFFTSKSFYCVYVCPYGAAQELVGKLKKKKKPLPQKIGKILRKVRMVFFYVIVLLLIVGLELDLTEYEPFSAFLFNAATPWVISVAVVFLILSILTPRAWCNYFCPTGYLLDIFRKAKKLKK